MGASKKTKTSETTYSQSSDAQVRIYLNQDEPIEVRRTSHPMRRDQGKRKCKWIESGQSDIEKNVQDRQPENYFKAMLEC